MVCYHHGGTQIHTLSTEAGLGVGIYQMTLPCVSRVRAPLTLSRSQSTLVLYSFRHILILCSGTQYKLTIVAHRVRVVTSCVVCIVDAHVGSEVFAGGRGIRQVDG